MLRIASKLFISLSPGLRILHVRPLSRFSRFYLARLSTAQHRRFSINLRTRLGFSVCDSEQFHKQPDSRDVSWETNSASPTNFRNSHPWPEWSKLVENLLCRGYFDRGTAVAVPDDYDDGFSMVEDLPEEFLRAVNACLLFARDRPELLSSLSRKDIEVLVENGSAFLFKNGMNSAGRLRSFLCTNGNNVLEVNKAHTVDVMQFLLSYACNPLLASGRTNLNNRELMETSVRNLLNELAHMSGMARESVVSEPTPRQLQDNHVQSSRPFGQNIEMKRGDWICPKCSFMNFARNVKCLECKEARPKRQLTGGEWECPQCYFFNYERNAVCLRCDCKRPGETLFGAAGSQSGLAYSGTVNVTNSNESDIESKLAANDEKAERWFRKVSQMDVPEMSSAVADEDFPEIMPLRKGVNRFVVSTRKTPLERRMEKDQYRQNLGNSSLPGVGNDFQVGNSGQTAQDKASDTSINQCLDRILGRPSAVPETNRSAPEKTYNQSATASEQRFSSSQCSQNLGNQRSDPGYVPFVPSPADIFSKPQNTSREASSGSSVPVSTEDGDFSLGSTSRGSITNTSHHDGLPITKPENSNDRESAQADRWFKKDQPPSLPQSKRRLAMDQSNSSNFVPFVPFPPDYFAKNKQPESGAPTEKASETSGPEKLPDMPKSEGFSHGTLKNLAPDFDSQRRNKDQQSTHPSLDSSKVGAAYGAILGNSAQQPSNLGTNAGEGLDSRSSGKENSGGSPTRQFERKSLEGSLVKEPDPLDMSEEAKAERWFRRVAQIKDISELSQIPDEDFPSIMPMRKGVNRFVVSKRKTPLERRLTSQQYRRSLPIVSSDPTKKEEDKSS